MKLIKLIGLFVLFAAVIVVAINRRMFFGDSPQPEGELAVVEQLADNDPTPGYEEGSIISPDDNPVGQEQAPLQAAEEEAARQAAEQARRKAEEEAAEQARRKAAEEEAARQAAEQARQRAAEEARRRTPPVNREKAREEMLRLVNRENVAELRKHPGWETALSATERAAALEVADLSRHKGLMREKIYNMLRRKYHNGYYYSWDEVVSASRDIRQL